MYGMVHEGLGAFVRERAGDDGWERVCDRAGAPVSTFPSLTTYPDALSAGLVVEAATELDVPVEVLLPEFGRFWVDYALGTAYGPLLRSSGSTLAETLAALDEMHSRIALTFPEPAEIGDPGLHGTP